jgi:hypothetical protein
MSLDLVVFLDRSSVMSEEPRLKAVPVRVRPVAQYFIERLLMQRERLSYEQWSSFERNAEVICNSILEQMPIDDPETSVWDNRCKRDPGNPQ